MNDNDLQKIRSVIREELVPVKKTLGEHTKVLGEHTKKLSSLDQITDKVDSLLGDMIDVQKKTGATYDLVKAIHEHDQRDIKEIKEHLKLPFIPSPFNESR